jgi:NAD+ diphosphatase
LTVEPPALGRVTYDRAAHRRQDAAWLADAWPRARLVLVAPDGRAPVIRAGNGAPELRFADSAPEFADASRRLLGVVDEVPYFSVTVPIPLGEADWAGLREIGPVADDLDVALLTSAVALEQWHGRHTHCPICGTPTVESQAGWTRTCPHDESEHFPRTDPAVIMVVHDGADRCLLGRGEAWGAGRFSTLAGFVEPGESLEGAVTREVWEEVRVAITDVRYVASQPWPFPASLMVGFVARVDGDPTPHVDEVEVTEAHWFSRDEVARAAARVDGVGVDEPDAVLQGISPKLSISRYLLDCWLAGEI